ncbi:TPA: hypothetical protein ACH3X3_000794 [Trebouxia sp. C0006]
MREDAAQQADLAASARNHMLSITPGPFQKATFVYFPTQQLPQEAEADEAIH